MINIDKPLALKLARNSLSEVIGQKHLIGEGKILTNLVKNKKNQNVPILTVHEGKLQEEIDKCFN